MGRVLNQHKYASPVINVIHSVEKTADITALQHPGQAANAVEQHLWRMVGKTE
ncbi:MAG: hypothetical protein E7I11_30940 [Klebsiella michiganensis]|nr:hypothetical protein [Klebsiella michiganensis]